MQTLYKSKILKFNDLIDWAFIKFYSAKHGLTVTTKKKLNRRFLSLNAKNKGFSSFLKELD